jgi:hypothetical protein
MGLYNFKPQFVPFILDGTKTHTIRAPRTHPDKPGSIFYLYTGLRAKRARLLLATACVKVEPIKISLDTEVDPRSGIYFNPHIWVAGIELDSTEADALARRDGFADIGMMFNFWLAPKNRLPFEGQIIHWRFPDAQRTR